MSRMKQETVISTHSLILLLILVSAPWILYASGGSVEVPENEFQYGLGTRKAIYIPYPQAVPHKAILDIENCTRCDECIKACKQDAISFDSGSTIK